MNVTFLTLSLSRSAGGLFFSVRSLAKAIEKHGAKMNVIAPSDSFTAADRNKWQPIDTHSYDVVGSRKLGYSRAVSPLLKSTMPDIQHVHGIWMYHSLVNHRTARKENTPYVISPRGMLDSWALSHAKWKKKIAEFSFERKHLQGAGCIHALCDSEAESIRRFGLKNPICVIPNGVTLFDLPTERRSNLDTRTLLFLGRIHPKKGLVNLLEAFGKLSKKGEASIARWRLVIAGWDQDHQATLESLASDLGIGDRIEFVGPKFGEEKEKILAECDAFVLPSHSEGLPMSVLESWSNAKPVLMTTACNIPEGSQKNAAIVVQPTVNDLAGGLNRLFPMSEEALLEMGENGRQLCETKFNWKLVSSQMLDVYRWLKGESDAPATVRFD